jgi:hypothetical protein
MKILLRIEGETKTSTLSKMYINEKEVPIAVTLEDGFKKEKIWGETRIPHGVFKIERRYVGRFYDKYKNKYQHKFSIWIRNVPKFKYILIHIGNYVSDTAGCPLIGIAGHKRGDNYMVKESTKMYKKFYEMVEWSFENNHEVWIGVDRSGSEYEDHYPISWEEVGKGYENNVSNRKIIRWADAYGDIYHGWLQDERIIDQGKDKHPYTGAWVRKIMMERIVKVDAKLSLNPHVQGMILQRAICYAPMDKSMRNLNFENINVNFQTLNI